MFPPQMKLAAMLFGYFLCELDVPAAEKACAHEESWRGKECFSWLLFAVLFPASQPGWVINPGREARPTDPSPHRSLLLSSKSLMSFLDWWTIIQVWKLQRWSGISNYRKRLGKMGPTVVVVFLTYYRWSRQLLKHTAININRWFE